MRGLIHVYTGDGKGKTTAAVGLAMRAYGNEMKVCLVQFLKSAQSGEITTIKKLDGGFELKRGKTASKFVFQMNDEEKNQCKKEMNELFSSTVDSLDGDNTDLLILDEIFAAISTKMLEVNDIVNFLTTKPEKLEVVLTGRNAPPEIIDIADYVMEIKSVKHPIDKGISARKGIEF